MVPWLLPINLCNRADNSYHHEEVVDVDVVDVEEEKTRLELATHGLTVEKREEEEEETKKKQRKKKKKKKEKKNFVQMRRNFKARVGPSEGMSTQIEMSDEKTEALVARSGSGSFRLNPEAVGGPVSVARTGSGSFLRNNPEAVGGPVSAAARTGSGSFRKNPEAVGGEDLLPGLDETAALRCLAFVSLADRPRLAQVGRQYRGLVRSPLLFDLRRTIGVIERWVCIYTSGDDAWAAYDPGHDAWRSLPRAHGVVHPVFEFSDRESLSAGTHLLWLGREAFQFAAYRFDLATNAWAAGPPMVTPRCLFASASCGAFAFVAGGFNVAGIGGGVGLGGASSSSSSSSSSSGPDILNSAERYDSRSGAWEPLPPMRTPRQKCSGVFMDGKFYVIGGKDKDHNPLTSAEVYDPSTKSWTTIADMYVGQETTPCFEPSPPLVAVADNELYSIDSSANVLKGYDKRSNAWKVLGPVPVRTDVCNGWGFAFKALGDELLLIGGFQESPSSREGVAIFSLRPRSRSRSDASTPDWHPHAPHPEWNLVNFRTRGSGHFLYNCAVMAC